MKRIFLTLFAFVVAVSMSSTPRVKCQLREASSVRLPNSAQPPIPLEFEINRGQAPSAYGFVAHGPTYSLGLSASEIALTLHHSSQSDSAASKRRIFAAIPDSSIGIAEIHLRLLGASKDAALAGSAPKPGVSNYFIGNDPAKWRTGVPHFGQVEMSGPYPGIDLVFYGNPQQLEYDFRVAGGADPNRIRLAMSGADWMKLDSEGNLVLGTAVGQVELKHPAAYQELNGVRTPVESGFRLVRKNEVAFNLGAYDHAKPLIIDPVLSYAVSIGGSNGNQGLGLDVDAAGNSYIAGNTCSTDFPSTAGNFQAINSNIRSINCQDAFVFKLDPTASTILYSDYIGGSNAQTATHIAVSGAGEAFVTGFTNSSNFPTLHNVGPSAPVACEFTKPMVNCPAGFILRLSADGAQLGFSSLLGGSVAAVANQVKLNPVTGDVVVIGNTDSSDFKPAPTTLQSIYQVGTCAQGKPCCNGFLLAFDPASGALRYGTYFAGTEYTLITGLAFDSTGDIYLSGSASPPFNSSLGPITHTYAPGSGAVGGSNAVIAAMHLNGTTLTMRYLTVLQASDDTTAAGLIVDASANAFLVGSTASPTLPVTSGVFQSATPVKSNVQCGWRGQLALLLPQSCGTAFVGELDGGGALSFLTFLGGSGQDVGEAIGQDSHGNLWLSGITSSADFPISRDGYSVSGSVKPSSLLTPFLAEMSGDGKKLPFASVIASGYGQAPDLKIDSVDNVYVTGFGATALSTPNVYPADPAAYNPVFVQKWVSGAQPVLQLSATSLTFAGTPYGGVTASQLVTAHNSGTEMLQLGILTVPSTSAQSSGPSDFLESDDCGHWLAAGASCTITAKFEPGLPPSTCTAANFCDSQERAASIVVHTNAAAGSQSILLSGTAGKGAALAVIPNPIAFMPQAAGTTSSNLDVFVQSDGDLALTIAGAAISGANAADFQIASLGTCARTIPATSSGCQLEMVFSPAASASGTRTASLVLTDNAAGSPHSVSITGSVPGPGAALLLSPTTAYLGAASIGVSASGPQMNITLTNASSDTSVQISSFVLSGTNKADFIVAPVTCSSSTLPFNIAKGASCVIQVRFNPLSGADGLRTATLALGTSPAIAGLPTVALSGDAVNNADASLRYFSVPSPLDFGSLQIGQTSPSGQNILVVSSQAPIPCVGGASSCGGDLTISSIASGTSDYTVVVPQQNAYCTSPPLTIPLNGHCNLYINFSPVSAGSRNSTLTVNSNDPIGPITIPVRGAGLALPLGNLSVTALDFGYSAIGTASPPLTVTLQNIGGGNLTAPTVTATADYSVVSNSCIAALVPSSRCTIGVAFTPPSAGVFPGTLTISDNDSFAGQQIVTLNGTGATGAALHVSPLAIDFGTQAENTASSAKTITVVNTGDTDIVFPANSFRVSADFIVQSTTCGTQLAVGLSCTVAVQFKPAVTYYDTGSLIITDNARGNPQTVSLVGTGTTSGGTPTISLTSSPNPSNTGQTVSFSVTVSGAGGNNPVPTGGVTLYDYVDPVSTATLNASGVAVISDATLTAGTHTLNAIYTGDSTYASVSSSVLTQVVNASTTAATTTVLKSSLNPSAAGRSVTFTATVSSAAETTTAPTGTMTFFDGSATLGNGTLNGSAQATFSTSTLVEGSHSITAIYSSDSNYAASTSSILAQVVNAATKLASTTTLSSSVNPASTAQDVTFTAIVAGPAGSTLVPTGTVTFFDGASMLGAATLNTSGQATYASSTLSAGSHTITAAYGADTVYAASTSAALALTVNSPPKAVTSTSISSSVNPATAGQTVTFTSTVSVNATLIPTGTVTFLDGAVTLGTDALNGSGIAAYAARSLAVGMHQITAQYGGDSHNTASTSTTLVQIIGTVPGFSIALSQTSLTLGRGQSGTVLVNIGTAGGFSGAIGLGCSGLPQFATCTLNPATVTPISGGASASSTLTIATDVTSAMEREPGAGASGGGLIWSAGLVLGLGTLAATRRRRSVVAWLRLRQIAGLVLAVVALAGLVHLTGCGGKGRPLPSQTPVGTTTITVTGKSGATTQTASFSLIVQ